MFAGPDEMSDLLIAFIVVLIVIAAGSAAKGIHELAVGGGHGEPRSVDGVVASVGGPEAPSG